MADDKTLKPKSFRIDDETSEKFKEIATSIGGSQQETLAKLIEAFEFPCFPSAYCAEPKGHRLC